MIIEGDILVQKIKVKKAVFKFPTLSFHYFCTNLHVTYISKDLFLFVILLYIMHYNIYRIKIGFDFSPPKRPRITVVYP